MTTKKKLKLMIKQFRVAELQSLLEFAGERSSSRLRKKELQKKALKLITRKRIAVLANKIKIMYRNMRGGNVEEDYFSDSEDSVDLGYLAEEPLTKYSFLDSYASTSTHAYFCASRPTTRQSFSSLTKNLDIQRLNNVQFTKLTFYKHESDILFLTPLIPRKQDGDIFIFDTTFPLNYANTADILFCENSRHHALLRFCVLNNDMEVNDYLPPMLTVKVNHHYCSLQFGAPVNITQYLTKNNYINSLSLQWSSDFYTLYGVVIQLVQKYTADELIDKLKKKGERDPAISMKLISENLNDQDNEIAATSLKMSLICPLGKMLMSLPTRASTCSHLHCFDGYLYIKMNEVKSSWQCPICNQECLYENLFIDGYFMDILRSDKFKPNITNIQLNADGTWESVMFQEKPKSRPKNSPVQVPEVSNEILKFDPPSDSERDLILRQNILDDLQRFLKNLSEISSHRSFPELFEDVPLVDNVFNVKPMNDADLSKLSTISDSEHLPKKDIILVDLTESDSESDNVRSVYSFSEAVNSSPLFLRNSLSRSSSPPVYDIDSDSSF